MSLQIRRGNETDRLSKTFDPGELIWTTDSNQLWVGDGIHAGGINAMASMAGVGLTYNQSTKKIDFTANGVTLSSDSLTEGSTNLFYTTARAQGAAAALFANGTHSHISFIYNPSSHSISATVDFTGEGILSVSADTNPSLGGSLNIGNYSITSTGTGNINIAGTISATSVAANTTISAASFIGTSVARTVFLESSNQYISSFIGVTDGTSSNAPMITFDVSKGSLSVPSNTIAGDTLSTLQFRGYYNGAYIPAVSVSGRWDAGSDPSSAYAGGTFFVGTGNNSNGFNILTFNSKGTLASSGAVQVGQFATGSYPATPAKGMIIFDSTTNHFFGYNGTTWQQFA